MTATPFQFTSRIKYLGIDEPRSGELMYFFPWRDKYDLVLLVSCENLGTRYDGGAAGCNWIEVKPCGIPSYEDGILRVPESLEGPGLYYTNYGGGGDLIPRTPTTDLLVSSFVTMMKRRDQAVHDREMLTSSLTKIFHGLHLPRSQT